MHLRMQDDQIGPKIVGLAPADMARLLSSIITKKIVVNNLVCQLGLCTCTYFELAWICKESSLLFIIAVSFYFLDFYA
jgi:hypothetical protein